MLAEFVETSSDTNADTSVDTCVDTCVETNVDAIIKKHLPLPATVRIFFRIGW